MKSVIEQIHNEFFTASDSIIAEAEQIIKTAATEKAARLNNVGFVKSKETAKLNSLSQGSAKVALEYKSKYQLNKFITYESAIAICNKYNLVMAPIDRFTGFVPEKNLKEIEGFRCKDQYSIHVLKSAKTMSVLLFAVLDQVKIKRYIKEGKGIIFVERSPLGGLSNFSETQRVEKEIEVLCKETAYGLEFTEISGLQICAPASDMDTAGLSVSGRVFGKKNIPDPVVLHPVNKGFLIVTAWGDEASDPIVVNELKN
jgi:hypothetical protein